MGPSDDGLTDCYLCSVCIEGSREAACTGRRRGGPNAKAGNRSMCSTVGTFFVHDPDTICLFSIETKTQGRSGLCGCIAGLVTGLERCVQYEDERHHHDPRQRLVLRRDHDSLA